VELIEVHERLATREEPPKRSKAIEIQIVAIAAPSRRRRTVAEYFSRLNYTDLNQSDLNYETHQIF
jgi:hypothetical protein